jgi:hypothetical protein
MWSRIRTAMMWLLLAALPVQGWAVATMVHCGPSHQRATLRAVDAISPVQHAHSHEGHDHGSHHASVVADDADTGPSPAGSDAQSLSMGKFKCSACATCCLGMALPSAVLTFDASVSSDSLEPGMPRGHAVFLTAGLERPPRTFLA